MFHSWQDTFSMFCSFQFYNSIHYCTGASVKCIRHSISMLDEKRFRYHHSPTIDCQFWLCIIPIEMSQLYTIRIVCVCVCVCLYQFNRSCELRAAFGPHHPIDWNGGKTWPIHVLFVPYWSITFNRLSDGDISRHLERSFPDLQLYGVGT